MSPTTPPPQPGLYRDSCGTPYRATLHPKVGWHLQKLGAKESTPYQRTDFPAAVNAGVFTFQPDSE